MKWKEELNQLLEKGCTDSDIEDFVTTHKRVSGRVIWDYVFESIAPAQCRGCKYIQYLGMHPCTSCSSRVKLKDFYEKR